MGTFIKWSRKYPGGYECSSKGDTRFSAFFAKMPDERSIEHWYQCDVKGWDPGGMNWKLGKGQPPQMHYPTGQLWLAYLGLWRLWAVQNQQLIVELKELAGKHCHTLTDCFANTEMNQAHALATIINEWLP
jgi:hypothetical protein